MSRKFLEEPRRLNTSTIDYYENCAANATLDLILRAAEVLENAPTHLNEAGAPAPPRAKLEPVPIITN